MDITSTFIITSTLFGLVETVGYITRYNDGCTVAALVDGNDHVVDGRTYRNNVSNGAILRQLFEAFELPHIRIARA